MNSIQDLFSRSRPIDRPIEKVIDYYATDEARLEREVGEYEVTDNVVGCFRRFLDAFGHGVRTGDVAEIGIWVSGFYGSGKSSFTKYLGFALDPSREIGGRRFLDYLCERIPSKDVEVQAALRTTARNIPTAVVMLDLGAEQLADSALAPVATVLYWKVLQWAGYAKEKKLAHLEFNLDAQGRLDAFRAAYEEEFPGQGRWEEIHNDPLLGVARADRLVPRFLPQEFPERGRFSALRFEEALDGREQARRMIELVRRRSGADAILFLVDEAGQYVAPRGELILNLDGLARNLKELGRGKVWLVSTGQQTLTEIVERAAHNSAELNKLRDRFPISIDLDARDIREITYRRLLTKSPEGTECLAKLFDRSGQSTLNFTRLSGTTLFKGDPDRADFLKFYPFLPQHFDLLLELIRTLARSTGGLGLRSAIRVIQDLLVDASRALPADATPLAHRSMGALACADDFYDTLRADIGKVLRHVVEGVDRVEKAFSHGGLEVRVAKAIGALQPIDGFPRTAENLAALLHPGLGEPGQQEAIREVLGRLTESKEFGIVDDPQAGGYLFLSEGVKPLRARRDQYVPTGGEVNQQRSRLLEEIFEPRPLVDLEGVKKVGAGLRFGRVNVFGEREEIHFLVEAVDGTRFEERRTELLSETASLPEYRKVIVWLVQFPEIVDDELVEACRSNRILQVVPEHDADKDVAQFLRSERRRIEMARERARKGMEKALSEGVLLFRGGPTPVAEAGSTVNAAARALLSKAGSELFPHLRLVSIRPSTDLAARFLGVERLDRMPSELDPLKVLSRKGGRVAVETGHRALAEVLRAFQQRLDESGGGRLQGSAVQELFASAPYGWSKDATRYLFAALLVAGEIEVHTAEGTLRTAGPAAVAAFKSTQTFNRSGLSIRGSRPPTEALERAATRLEELFASEVLPLEDRISEAVRRHVPGLLERVGSLPDRLRLLGLPGEDRSRGLLQNCADLIKEDAGAAAMLLGAKDSALPRDVRWARALIECLDGGAEGEIRHVTAFLIDLEDLSTLFPGPTRGLVDSEDLEMLRGLLASEDIHERMVDARGALRRSLERVCDSWRVERALFDQALREARETLEGMPEWVRIITEDQAEIASRLVDTELSQEARAGHELADLRLLLTRAAARLSLLATLQQEVRNRIPPPPLPDPEKAQEPERVLLEELAPSQPLRTSEDLERWLEQLRDRLSRPLRENRSVEILRGERV